MKRSLSIFIAFFMGIVALFSVAGCNGGTQNELQSKIDALQSQIEELNEQINRDLKDKIPTSIVLRISTEKEVYGAHEDFFVDITLENRCGMDIEVAYYRLFYPESSTGQFPAYEQPPVTTKKVFRDGEIIRETDRLGGCFPEGTHELKYTAVFYLEWEMTEFGWETTNDRFEVWSNTIEFSIVE